MKISEELKEIINILDELKIYDYSGIKKTDYVEPPNDDYWNFKISYGLNKKYIAAQFYEVYQYGSSPLKIVFVHKLGVYQLMK